MKKTEKTDLPLAADIAAVVSEAAPKLDDLDVEAEAERLADEHPESDASAEMIAEVIEDQIEAEKSDEPRRRQGCSSALNLAAPRRPERLSFVSRVVTRKRRKGPSVTLPGAPPCNTGKGTRIHPRIASNIRRANVRPIETWVMTRARRTFWRHLVQSSGNDDLRRHGDDQSDENVGGRLDSKVIRDRRAPPRGQAVKQV